MKCFILGIKFIFKNSIVKFLSKEDDDKVLNKIELQDGTILSADIVILGIGSLFNTDWLKGSSIKMLDDGTVEVDKVQLNRWRLKNVTRHLGYIVLTPFCSPTVQLIIKKKEERKIPKNNF